MPLWGSTVDNAAQSPIFGGNLINKTPNTGNRNALFGNVTPNAHITGQTVSVAGVGANEIASYLGGVAHTGWVKRTIGQGGRAGRVHHEVLVAGGFGTSNTVDITVTIRTHPASASANAGAAASFTVNAFATPVGTLVYRWQTNTGSGFVNLATNAVFTNTSSDTLAIANVTGLNNHSYRAIIGMTGATDQQTSANATLSVGA